MTWLTAAAKMAPHVASIAHAVLPVFTQRKHAVPAVIESVELKQQIAELQSAASQNAENIRKLASDLQSAIAALEQGGTLIEARLRRMEMLVYCAVGLALIAGLAAVALWLR